VNDEHSEVAKAADDYLWLKLCQIREEDGTESQVTDRMTYAHLQSLILEEYGRYLNKVNSLFWISSCAMHCG
jgi:nuclear pore complex protein Nup93